MVWFFYAELILPSFFANILQVGDKTSSINDLYHTLNYRAKQEFSRVLSVACKLIVISDALKHHVLCMVVCFTCGTSFISVWGWICFSWEELGYGEYQAA